MSSQNNLLFLGIAVGVGLLLGAASHLLSPFWVLVGLAGGGLVYFVFKRPEVGLLCILLATSTIVFEDSLPLIPIGIGSLHISDVLLLALLGLILLRWLVELDFKIVRTPLDWPLLIFLGMALLSTSSAVFQSSVGIEEARRAIRPVSYYLTFIVVTNLVRDKRQLRFLLSGLFFLANIVAVVMIIQFVLGESVHLLPGYVGDLNVSGEVYSGTTRIVPPGRSLVVVSFITMTAMLGMVKFRPGSVFGFLQWILLGLALLLTFLRSYWFAVGVALFLLAYLSKLQVRRRLIGWGLVVVVLSPVILLMVFDRPESRVAKLVIGSYARLSTLGSTKTLGESSLQWRYVENEYALAQIISHPILGLGLGARYRPFDQRIDYPGMTWDARKFIHNGHLWVLVTTGLLGYLNLMWLSLAFLMRGFRYWQSIADDRMRGVVLGFTLVYLAVLIAAVVNSDLVQWRWTPVIGIMMGINEVILMKFREEESVV